MDYLGEYFKGGHRQLWATRIYEDSMLSVASAAKDDEIRARIGKKAPEERPRHSLKDLFLRLSPAVPIVITSAGTGSGFLVKHGGKYVVVTNRHVVENRGQTITVRFLKRNGEREDELTVSVSEVLAIHRTADLALLDVSQSEQRIREWGVQPVSLAAASHVPQVGEHVFAIGHPVGGGKLLTRTLSDGIVSATGRTEGSSQYLQVTVPINPGNSGGPLFDDEGQVVGVNTFVIRRSQNQELALEALNFALELGPLHEVLADDNKSLNHFEIVAVLRKRDSTPASGSAMKDKLTKTAKRYAVQGYRLFGNSLDAAVRVFPLASGGREIYTGMFQSGRSYAVEVLAEGTTDIDAAVVSEFGQVISTAARTGSDASLTFVARSTCYGSIVVMNPTRRVAAVVLIIFER
jgi:S1-C subfamily serine protease